jgi:hypothetical protein
VSLFATPVRLHPGHDLVTWVSGPATEADAMSQV